MRKRDLERMRNVLLKMDDPVTSLDQERKNALGSLNYIISDPYGALASSAMVKEGAFADLIQHLSNMESDLHTMSVWLKAELDKLTA